MADAMRSESNLVSADILDVTSFEIRVAAALDGLHFWLKWIRLKSKERIDIAAQVKLWQRQTSRVRASSAVLFRPHRCLQCGSTACRSLNIFWASEGVRPTYTVSVVPAMLLPCSNVVDVRTRTTKASEFTIVKRIASTM